MVRVKIGDHAPKNGGLIASFVLFQQWDDAKGFQLDDTRYAGGGSEDLHISVTL